MILFMDMAYYVINDCDFIEHLIDILFNLSDALYLLSICSIAVFRNFIDCNDLMYYIL